MAKNKTKYDLAVIQFIQKMNFRLKDPNGPFIK